MLALGEAGTRCSLKLQVAPVGTCVFDTGAVDGFGWSSFTRREGDGAGLGRRDRRHRGARRAGERTPAGHRRRERRHVHARDGDGLRVDGCGRLVDDGDGGDTYNYSPPADDLVDRPPDAVRVETTETGPVRGRGVTITADYTWPTFAVGDERACSRRERRDGARHRPHDARTAAAANGSCGSRTRSTIRRAIIGCAAHFPLSRAGRRVRRGVHVRGRAPRPDGGGRRARVRAADVPVASLRRRVRRHCRARARPRRPARVRGRRRRPRPGAHGAGARSATSPAPNRSCGRIPPDRRMRSKVRSSSASRTAEYAVMLHAGDWQAADCYGGAADALLVPFERAGSRSHTDASRPIAGSATARRRRGGVGRPSPRSRRPGRACVPHRDRARPGHDRTRRCPRPRLPHRPPRPPVSGFEGEVELRRAEIATLQIADT